MDEQIRRRVMTVIRDNGPYVIAAGVIRQKGGQRKPLRASKAMMMQMVASGHIVIKNSHVSLTSSGSYLLSDIKERNAEWVRRMRDRGCIRKSIWLHPDDIARFEEFMTTTKGIADD